MEEEEENEVVVVYIEAQIQSYRANDNETTNLHRCEDAVDDFREQKVAQCLAVPKLTSTTTERDRQNRRARATDDKNTNRSIDDENKIRQVETAKAKRNQMSAKRVRTSPYCGRSGPNCATPCNIAIVCDRSNVMVGMCTNRSDAVTPA
jgi:hypothetical protein